jgi:hypothetical protein
MAVTEDQVAALRAQLAGNFDEHKRLLEQLDPVAAQTGYTALIAAAFFEAVDRRFAENGAAAGDADVIEFVGSLRSRADDAAEKIDPSIAERLIHHSLGRGSISDIDDKTVVRTQMLVLAGLIADAQLSDAELDEFMAEVRTVAEEWTS